MQICGIRLETSSKKNWGGVREGSDIKQYGFTFFPCVTFWMVPKAMTISKVTVHFIYFIRPPLHASNICHLCIYADISAHHSFFLLEMPCVAFKMAIDILNVGQPSDGLLLSNIFIKNTLGNVHLISMGVECILKMFVSDTPPPS